MITDKVVLITGGAQGIGKAFSTALLKNKAKAVIICDVNETVGLETVSEFQKEFGSNKVEFMMCNVSDSKQFQGCITNTIQKYGGLDILINNAGLFDETEDGWRKMMEVNLVGVTTGTKLCMKYMSRTNGGCGGLVINISSIAGLMPFPIAPVYGATKAAINQLTRCYGSDFYFEDTGVKVISINPGVTQTKILDDIRDNAVNSKAKEMLVTVLEAFPSQKVETVGNGLIEVMKKAENGSLWTIMNDQDPEPSVLS